MQHFKLLGIILTVLFILVNTGNCIRKPSQKVKKVSEYKPITYNIALNLNAGFITGKYGDRLKGIDGNMNDQMFGGYGGCFEYHLKKYIFFSADFDRGVKKYNDQTITANMYGIGAGLKLGNQTSSYPYLGAGLGSVTGDVSGREVDLGTSSYLMFKFGYCSHYASKMNTKLELYYRTISVSKEIKNLVNNKSSLTTVGARFILGLGF